MRAEMEGKTMQQDNTAVATGETTEGDVTPSVTDMAAAEAALAALPTADEVETTEPTEPAAEPEATTPDAEEESSEETEEKPEEAEAGKDIGWQKRVDKLTAQKKQALEEAERLKAENAELKAKMQTMPDGETLAKSGLAAGYATADEAKVVAKDNDLQAAANWLRSNRTAAMQQLEQKFPNETPEDLRFRLLDWRESVQEQLMAVRPQAQQIRDRVARELQADIEAARKVKGTAKPTTSAPAAATKAKLSAMPKKTPTVVLSGSGAAGSGVRGVGKTSLSRETFEARAKLVGHEQAAAEALAALG